MPSGSDDKQVKKAYESWEVVAAIVGLAVALFGLGEVAFTSAPAGPYLIGIGLFAAAINGLPIARARQRNRRGDARD